MAVSQQEWDEELSNSCVGSLCTAQRKKSKQSSCDCDAVM
jgi:hypothetical protein